MKILSIYVNIFQLLHMTDAVRMRKCVESIYMNNEFAHRNGFERRGNKKKLYRFFRGIASHEINQNNSIYQEVFMKKSKIIRRRTLKVHLYTQVRNNNRKTTKKNITNHIRRISFTKWNCTTNLHNKLRKHCSLNRHTMNGVLHSHNKYQK